MKIVQMNIRHFRFILFDFKSFDKIVTTMNKIMHNLVQYCELEWYE